MGFNYAAEKKKFETLWARLRREYTANTSWRLVLYALEDFLISRLGSLLKHITKKGESEWTQE